MQSSNSSVTLASCHSCPLLRLPPELLLNRLDHEVLDHDVVRHAVQLEATVKLLRDARRQLRQDFFGLGHQTFVFFGGRPGPPGRHFPRRFRRRPFFAFGLLLDTLPNSDWIAERTSSCTRSRITVTRLFCLRIEIGRASCRERV